MSFKQSLKSNIISTNNKYNKSTEKIALIIGENEKSNSYSISIVTNDGVNAMFEDICVRLDGSNNTIQKDPEIGEYVYVKEDNGRYVITGIYKEYQSTTIVDDFFTNLYNATLGGFIY